MLSISQSLVFQKQMKFVPLVEMSEDKKYEYTLFNLDTSASVFSTTDITTDSIFLIMIDIPDNGLFPTSFTYKGNVFIKYLQQAYFFPSHFRNSNCPEARM